MKTLLVTMDFSPLIGGISQYYFNRISKMRADEIVVLMNIINSKLSTSYKLQVTSYNFKIYYKNFFTKLIWPHWLPLIWHIWRIVRKEKINRIWIGQILPVGTAVWIVNKIINFFRGLDSRWSLPRTAMRGGNDKKERGDDKKLLFFVTCHGNDLLRAKNNKRKYKLAKKILNTAEFVEANTEFTKNILINDFNLPNEKIKIVYPECTLSREQIDNKKVEELRKRYNLKGKKVLLTVARLVESKGIKQVIKALPKVWEQIPELVYLIIGDGPDKNRLIEITNELVNVPSLKLAPPSWVEPVANSEKTLSNARNMADKVIFTGAVPHNELPNYYALADAFILTPRKNVETPRRGVSTDTESFGIVYLEALEFDLPVIAGDTGGVREILKCRDEAVPRLYRRNQQNNFILVDSENIDEIAEKIKNLFKI